MRSDYEGILSSDGLHTPDGSSFLTLESLDSTFEIVKFRYPDEGAQPPSIPR